MKTLVLACAILAGSLNAVAQEKGTDMAPLLRAWSSESGRVRESAGRQLSALAEADLDGTVRAVMKADAARTGEFLDIAFRRLRLDVGRPSTGVQWGRYLFFDGDGLPATIPMAMKVAPKSPAAKAGMKPGDSIVAVDGKAMPGGDSFLYFKSLLGSRKPGDTIHFKIMRMQLGKRPHRIWDVGKKPESRQAKVVLGGPITKPCRTPGTKELATWKKQVLEAAKAP